MCKKKQFYNFVLPLLFDRADINVMLMHLPEFNNFEINRITQIN